MGRILTAPLKLLMLIIIFAIPFNANAEYYLVYPPPGVVCVSCGTVKHYKKHYKKISHVKKKHYIRKRHRPSPYGLTIRTRYVCPAIINCAVVPATPCMTRYYEACQYKKVKRVSYKKVSYKKYYKYQKHYAHKRVYCATCSYPPVIFSGMPTSYVGAYEVNDCNISYDLRTADDDVYRDPSMNYGY